MKHEYPLEVKNLDFQYPNKHGIHDISFHLDHGEVVCLFGKNGSGKTTLLHILSTLEKPQSGHFFVFGLDGVKKKEQVRKHLFPVFDENAHFDFATGQKNLEFFLRLYKSSIDTSVNEWFTNFGLDLTLKTREYSMGMKRKLYLLEAILARSNILLFDEPTLGLDSESRDKIFHWMQNQKNSETSIIFGTNRFEEVKYADRVILLDKGRINHESSVESLKNDMLTIKIRTKDNSFIDYVESINEVPDLIKKYISFGIPKNIEIIGADDNSFWTTEAIEKIEHAPKFIRKMIHKMVESYAKDKGISKITPEIVDDARRRFEKR